MTEPQFDPGQREIYRRIENIEEALGNGKPGRYVRRDVFEAVMGALSEDLKEMREEQKWLMRGLVAMLLGILGQAVFIAIQLSGAG